MGKAFSERGDLVYDPFTGTGTVPSVCRQTGRNFIASELDEARAEQARTRVENTPMPLFHYEPELEQLNFGLEETA